MENIVLKTKYLEYSISSEGKNLSFTNLKTNENRILDSYACFITENDRSQTYPIKASYNGEVLTYIFSDDTEMNLKVDTYSEFLTFTLLSISREDFLSVAFVNVLLDDNSTTFEGVLMGLTLATRMIEHPGDNRVLRAEGFAKIGLLSTKRSKYPVKCAIFGCPHDKVTEIEKDALKLVAKGELPLSNLGGPNAEKCKDEAKGTYLIMFDTVTMANVDETIKDLKDYGVTQIDLHHRPHFYQGDFRCNEKIFGGIDELKQVVKRFHENDILVSLHTYTNFLSRDSSFIYPIPHKDVDIMNEFTLSSDIDDNTLSFSVEESTEGITPTEGYLFMNSPFLWIDDEIVKFELADNGKFILQERGALKTIPNHHKKGAKVKQLKLYFRLPMAKAGSELFYEIARRTANLYNELEADIFYLDALDGLFVLEGEDYLWYHAVDFLNEMFKHLKRDIIFNCCYNPAYTGSWYARSRYGAIDSSGVAHRKMIDAHVIYNNKTAKRMRVTPEIGWSEIFEVQENKEVAWTKEAFYDTDLEYMYAKAFALDSSLTHIGGFANRKKFPIAEDFKKVIHKYVDFMKDNKPTEKTVNWLNEPEQGAYLEDGVLYKSVYLEGRTEHEGDIIKVDNPFEKQFKKLRLEAMAHASSYDSEDAITLVDIDEKVPVKEVTYDFNPVVSNGKKGLGVWCYGDGSGAIMCICVRCRSLNTNKVHEHYIKLDFVGWRYFAFVESQNGIFPAKEWDRVELLYNSYIHLQTFYGYYRSYFDYDSVDGISIKIKGSCKAYLKPIKLVDIENGEIVNPTIETNNGSITFATKLNSYDYLEYDGNICQVKNREGKVLCEPAVKGCILLNSGIENVKVTSDTNNRNNLLRTKLTFVTKGEKLQ